MGSDGQFTGTGKVIGSLAHPLEFAQAPAMVSDSESEGPPPSRRASRPTGRPRARPSHIASTTSDDTVQSCERIDIGDDGRTLIIRPIQPTDAAALQRAFLRLEPTQVRARFFHRIKELDGKLAARLCRVTPERGAAYVAVDEVADAQHGEIRAEARVHFNATTAKGEFAIVVDPEFLGVGIGRALLGRLVRDCRERQLGELWGDVLADNHAMLAFVAQLGLDHSIERSDEAGVVRVRLRWPGLDATARS